MSPFFFRSDRLEHDLKMRVGLQDMHGEQSLSGLLTTTVINFSPEGACLVIPKLAIDGKHLFFDTLHSNDYALVLFSEELGKDSDQPAITAESIWMDSCLYQNKPAFKIGIRFLHKQDQLFKNLKRKLMAS